MEKKKSKKIIRNIIIAALIIICAFLIFCLVRFFIYQYGLSQKENEFEDLRVEDLSAYEGNSSNSPVHDFDALQKENSDIYAYLVVDGTKVDYPVLQNAQNDYYLDKNLDLSVGYPACIYTNPVNSKDFSDNITVIYGHNMKNKTMFGSLHSYDDEDFFKANNKFEIETPEALYSYQIFAAVNYNDDLITSYYPPSQTNSISKFVTSMREEGTKKTPDYFDDSVEVTDSDKIVVLSTCIGGQDDRRLLVVGKLIDTVSYSGITSTDE